MDYWTEEMVWRNSGGQEGPDDWDFYRDKYGFSEGKLAEWDSGSLKELPSYAHPNSYFRIKKSLDHFQWLYIMGILARIDVSQIEHMELELPGEMDAVKMKAMTRELRGEKDAVDMEALRRELRQGRDAVEIEALRLEDFRGRVLVEMEALRREFPGEMDAVEMKALTRVLGSGRFSGLRTLRMGFKSKNDASRPYSMRRMASDCNVRSVYLAEALRTGRFTNLLTLSLPECYVGMILQSLKAGKISQLRSFSIIDNYPYRNISSPARNIGGFLKSGCFKRLQHFGFQGWPAGCDDDRDLEVFIEEGFEAPKNLPNLTSLSLSYCKAVNLRRIVPFLLRSSNPLENLILHDCKLDPGKFAFMVKAAMDNRVTGLALKHLDLYKNGLDDTSVKALVDLSNADKLAQLEELDLSENVGLNSRTVESLKKTILSGHLRSLRLLIWEYKAEETEKGVRKITEAFARPYNRNSGLPDQWFHVHSVPTLTGGLKVSVHDSGASGLEEALGTEPVGTILPVDEFSTIKKLIVKIVSFEGLGERGSCLIRGALKTLGVSSLPTSPSAVRDVDELTLSLPALHIKSLGAFSSVHTKLWRSFSIDSRERLDDLSRSILCQKLDEIFKSGCFKWLQHLELSVIDGIDGWKVLIDGIRSGQLNNIRSMRLSHSLLNQVNLADLAPLLLISSFETLVMHSCLIAAEQVWGLADAIMKGPRTSLALKQLELGDNLLGNRAVEALVNLANSDFISQLKALDLSMNKALGPRDLISLMDTIQSGHLPSLYNIKWGRNAVNEDAARHIVAAYYVGRPVKFDIDWNRVEDPSLKTQAEKYRERNIRLTALKEKHKELFEEEVPLTRAKVFLGGYPEVGKTTLRRALTQCLPDTPQFKETRTRGIELSFLKGRTVTLTLWDLAGHEEYHVLHGTFFPDLGLAAGKATTFLLVFKASSEKCVERDLLYWLRFAASSSQKFVRRHVVIVLNCFGGKQLTEGEKRSWMASLQNFQERFKDFLDIHQDPFVIDVRLPTVVEPLKNYLFEKTEVLLRTVTVPKVCFELEEKVERWLQRENNGLLPIISWQVFEMHLNLKHSAQQSSGTDLKAAALYLHEIGRIIYFDNQKSSGSGSEKRSVVILDPDWFCSKVVGELLLPEEWLEGKGPLRVKEDGSIARHLFEIHFKHLLFVGTQSDDIILMLERLGLCYRKNAEEIIVPALIQRDDHTLTDWEAEGSHVVMGRRLAVEDHERSAIPVTLFRRVQVELAKDLEFGGRGDSKYRAGKSFSSFKVGALLVLIQFNVDQSNPKNDRIDILVKSSIHKDLTNASRAQAKCICEILEKLEKLCVACCPGLGYDIKAIQPWSATERTPEMIERDVMSLREIKVLLMKNKQSSGWSVNGNPVELTSFFSENELEKVLEMKRNWRMEIFEVTDELNVSPKAGEETNPPDDSDASAGSEDGGDLSENGTVCHANSDESKEALGGSGEETDPLDYWCTSRASEGSEDGGDLSEDGIVWHETSDEFKEALGEVVGPGYVSTPLIAATSSVQLDDMVFEVYSPADNETPELEVVFFHGLELQYQTDDTYRSTWMTRDNSQLWLRTLLVPEFPETRMLIVSYDASPKKTYTNGLLDMYLTAENLLNSLTSDGVKVGQSGRPVVLVGHCLGGLVIKELCLMAMKNLNLMKDGSSEKERIKNLVDSLKGMFYYATAHVGSPMVDLLHKYIQAEGLLLDQMEILNKHCARRNSDFEKLRQRRRWLTRGVAELRETYLESLGESMLVVPEASARHDMDSFITDDADHFDICKPAGSVSSSFQFFAGFLRQIRDAELRSRPR